MYPSHLKKSSPSALNLLWQSLMHLLLAHLELAALKKLKSLTRNDTEVEIDEINELSIYDKRFRSCKRITESIEFVVEDHRMLILA